MWLLGTLLACTTSTPPAVTAPVEVADEAPAIASMSAAPILDRPVVLGALPEGAIHEAFADRAAAFGACWAPDGAEAVARGKVLVRFTVAEQGRVAKAEVKATTVRRDDVERCLLDAVKATSFPPPANGGSAIVTWPFVVAPPA